MDAQRDVKDDNRTSENPRSNARRAKDRESPLSDDAPLKTVRVAVLPSSNSLSVGSPVFGSGLADAYNLQRHRSTPSASSPSSSSDVQREQSNDQQQKKKKNLFRKLAKPLNLNHPTTPEPSANNVPPFVMKTVPYDEWRRHYAKDAEGNYRGTHAPAKDCLLKPHDVEKWQCKTDDEDLGEGEETEREMSWTKKFTRGNQVLPVYAEVVEDGMVPGYEADYEAVDDEQA